MGFGKASKSNGRIVRDFTGRGRSRASDSEHQPEQREHPVPVLSRRVGHRRVYYAKRPGQRDAQPAEQLWQQLLGVLGERDVPGWSSHHLAQQLTDLLGLLELVELAHSLRSNNHSCLVQLKIASDAPRLLGLAT